MLNDDTTCPPCPDCSTAIVVRVNGEDVRLDRRVAPDGGLYWLGEKFIAHNTSQLHVVGLIP